MHRFRFASARLFVFTFLAGFVSVGLTAQHVDAQPLPADFVSGTYSGTATGGDGPATTTLMTVPVGKVLVVTDLDYSVLWDNEFSGNNVEGPVILASGATERWSTFVSGFTSTAAGTEGRDMLSKSFSTGIAFGAGTTADVIHHAWVSSFGGPTVYWRLSWSGYLATSTTTGILDPLAPEQELRLGNAAPNPMDEETRLSFNLGRESRIVLRVVDVRGRVVRDLFDGLMPAGPHGLTWNARYDDGRAVPSGVYFIELLADNQRQARKVIVMN